MIVIWRRRLQIFKALVIFATAYYIMNGVSKLETPAHRCQNVTAGSLVISNEFIGWNGTSPNDADCRRGWGRDLELFLPVPPKGHLHFRELGRVLLPSLAMFWPMESMNLLVITDGEMATPSFNSSIVKLVAQSGINTSIANVRLAYNYLGVPPIKVGWFRQQWLMFWADNFTQSEYVGFVDTDAHFIRPVLRSDIFVNDRPIIRSMYTTWGHWWRRTMATSFKVIGKLVPMHCMMYFPVVIKTKHFAPMREHIVKTLKEVNFDYAFRHEFMYEMSQFNIMCSYLWYFKRDEYYWMIYRGDPPWGGRFAEEQVTNLTEAGMTEEYFQPVLPFVSQHFQIEKFRKNPGRLPDTFRRGFCFPALMSGLRGVPRFCENYVKLAAKPNYFEWMYEGFEFRRNETEAVATHAENMKAVNKCPWHFDRRVLELHLHVRRPTFDPLC